MEILLLVLGCGLLVLGGEWLVSGAGALARRTGMSVTSVGLTVVALATSAPELAVTLGAAAHGETGLALGNVVGSNVANILLVLGAAALVAPVGLGRDLANRDLPMALLMAVLLVALAWDGALGRLDGAVLLGCLVANLWLAVRAARVPRGPSVAVDVAAQRPRARRSVLLVLAGAAALVVGAEALVRAASSIAVSLGVPDLVIGLTVVALGTSLPELAAGVTSSRRGSGEAAAGNAVGSNIANVGLVLGLPALVLGGLATDVGALRVELVLMVALTVGLWGLARSRGRVGRLLGGLMLAAYLAHLAAVAFLAR